MNKWIIIYGGPLLAENVRVSAAKNFSSQIDRFILTGTQEEIERMKWALSSFSIAIAPATNTVENVCSVISEATRRGIKLESLIHVSNDFHLERIKIIWGLFGINVAAEALISADDVLGDTHSAVRKWKASTDYAAMIADEPRKLKGVTKEAFGLYWLPQVARSEIGNDYFRRALASAGYSSLSREKEERLRTKLAETPRMMPP